MTTRLMLGAVKRLATNIGRRTYTHVEAGAVPGVPFILPSQVFDSHVPNGELCLSAWNNGEAMLMRRDRISTLVYYLLIYEQFINNEKAICN